MNLSEALKTRRSHRDFSGDAVGRETVEQLVYAAQGVTGEGGLRTAPSAHALHPLHLSVSVARITGMDVGLHKVDRDGSISFVRSGEVQAELEEAAIGEQPWVGTAAGVLTVSADFAGPTAAFAGQPPFGRRGPGNVYIEAGAAAQNVALQAAESGLGCVLVAGFSDKATAAVLRLPAPFSPVLHLCFGWPA
ncbi:MAG: nitroreductase family protein [Pikeienuella sp.]